MAALLGNDDVHISSIERVLKTGRDALFGVRVSVAATHTACTHTSCSPAAGTGPVPGSQGHKEQSLHSGACAVRSLCVGAVQSPARGCWPAFRLCSNAPLCLSRATAAMLPHPARALSPLQIVLQVINFMQMLVFPLCVRVPSTRERSVRHSLPPPCRSTILRDDVAPDAPARECSMPPSSQLAGTVAPPACTLLTATPQRRASEKSPTCLPF